MSNREDILANFQQITEINDIELAIAHLESTNWDLEAAIHLSLDGGNHTENNAFADFNKTNSRSNSPYHTSKSMDDVLIISDDAGPSTSSLQSSSAAAASGDTTRKINFIVQHNDSIHKISIPEQNTINDLKQLVMDKTAVPVCRQLLKGWPTTIVNQIQNGNTSLKSLKLPDENNLELTDITNEGITDDVFGSLATQNETSVYQLRIKYTNEDRYLNLNFPATKTIIEIKNDLYAVLKIPVRFQQWKGWPENVPGTSKLDEIGIEHIHMLELTRIDTEQVGTSSRFDMPVEIDSDTDSPDEDNFEDALNADEDMFAETSSQNRLKLLIEDQIEDEILGCLQFVSNYRDRYGHGPNFFEGNLYDALNTACGSKSAKDRKLLAVYLHHDQSVLTNVFCGQLLGNENIIKLLNENYVLYGWDLTCESNKNMFLSSLTACVTDSASLQIRQLPTSQFPIIMIIRKHRSVSEVADMIHGNINGDELYIHLMMNLDAYNEQMKIEIREENERAAREDLMKEQQEAYELSLLADRAKEEERQRKEMHEATEREKLDSERQQIEAKKENERKAAEDALPPEPASDCTEPISIIRFRTPKGDFIGRRFIASNPLMALLNFATANGFSPSEYKIISSYPRRDLTSLDHSATLKNLNLFPQETLIFEER